MGEAFRQDGEEEDKGDRKKGDRKSILNMTGNFELEEGTRGGAGGMFLTEAKIPVQHDTMG